MENNIIQLSDLVVSSLTLVATLITGYLAYRLQKEKKRIERLEKYYGIAIENLQANYEIEQYLAERLNIRFRTSFSQIRKANKVNDLTSNELHNIIQDGKGLAFLEDEAENIYTDDNLKVKF